MGDEVLSKIPLFAGLSPDERADLGGLLKTRQYQAQAPVFWIGENGTEFYIGHSDVHDGTDLRMVFHAEDEYSRVLFARSRCISPHLTLPYAWFRTDANRAERREKPRRCFPSG